MSTYTATIVENDTDVTDLTITVTDQDGTEVDWVSCRTGAYGDPTDPLFDFDAERFDADIAAALTSAGWFADRGADFTQDTAFAVVRTPAGPLR